MLLVLMASLLPKPMTALADFEDVKLAASDGANGDDFGSAVSISGNAALVAASGDDEGSAYIFRFDGTSWVQEAKLGCL